MKVLEDASMWHPPELYAGVQISLRQGTSMKPNGQRKETTADAPKKNIVTPGKSNMKKSMNSQRGPRQNARKNPAVFSFNATQVPDQQLPGSETCIETKYVASLEHKRGQVNPSMKIKLQLFPVDEATRTGIEKDGLNPFLELTLRARKKITSVIKHIHTKWGSSSIALGELMLFPYKVHLGESAMNKRWTLKDANVSAGDVYAAIESPPIFRLRYGWFSDGEPQRISVASTPYNCLGSESVLARTGTLDNDGMKQIEITEERKRLDANETAEVPVIEHVETKAKIGNGPEQPFSAWDDGLTNLSIGGLLSEASLLEKISNSELKSNQKGSAFQSISAVPGISVGGLLSEASLQRKLHNSEPVLHFVNSNEPALNGRIMAHEQAPIQWDDSLTALSIGGLLGEASLQAKINSSEPKSNEGDVVGQRSAFTSDSFDAVIASQTKNDPQVAKISSFDSHSSILDAEETCHAFSFRKFSSSSKNVRVTVRANQNSSSNTFKFPGFSEVNRQTGIAEDTPCQEMKRGSLPHLQNYSEDSKSLGLRGINWTESLGPFDLGLSMARKVFDEDSTGTRGII